MVASRVGGRRAIDRGGVGGGGHHLCFSFVEKGPDRRSVTASGRGEELGNSVSLGTVGADQKLQRFVSLAVQLGERCPVLRNQHVEVGCAKA